MKRRIFTIILSVFLVPAAWHSADSAVTRIELQGLNNTEKSLVTSKLKNRENKSFNYDHWLEERNMLMDLDIFADVQYYIEETEEGEVLIYRFRELPAFLVFPAMKRTDQDGFLMGPGITHMNLLGLGIHQEIMARFTMLPEFMRAKEFLYYLNIPDRVLIPLKTELEINLFDSYNALKLYHERSIFSRLGFTYSFTGNLSMVVGGSALFVKHDPDVSVFTELNRDVDMFLGEGSWDFIPTAGTGFIIDTRNRVFNAHRGIYSETGVSVSGEKLGGDGDFYELKEDLRLYVPAGDKHILHANILARFRPGKIPAYELYHIGGVNSLRTFTPDPDICAQDEILATVEYRYELFTNRQISLFDLHGYYGLQLVLGTDHAFYREPGDSWSDRKYLSSVFAGIHLLVPALERVRLEFGVNGYDESDRTIRFGINLGWYEKAYTQGRRVR